MLKHLELGVDLAAVRNPNNENQNLVIVNICRDPDIAAQSFNWLIMASPLNAATMLGNEAILTPPERSRTAAEATRVFLAAYGPDRH